MHCKAICLPDGIKMHYLHNAQFITPIKKNKQTHFLSQGTIQVRDNSYEHSQVRRACTSKFPFRALTFQNTWSVTLTLTWNHYSVIRHLPIVIIIFFLVLALTLPCYRVLPMVVWLWPFYMTVLISYNFSLVRHQIWAFPSTSLIVTLLLRSG